MRDLVDRGRDCAREGLVRRAREETICEREEKRTRCAREAEGRNIVRCQKGERDCEKGSCERCGRVWRERETTQFCSPSVLSFNINFDLL